MAMDVKRDPAILRQKKIKRAIWIGLGVVVLAGVSIAVSRLQAGRAAGAGRRPVD